MAILGKIRQRSIFLILVIGMALFAFVISGVFSNQGANAAQTIGSVNGEDIPADEFRSLVEQQEARYQGNVATTQVVNQVWDQKIRETIFAEQFEELGLNPGADKLADFLEKSGYGNSPQFQNEAGLFDKEKFRAWVLDQKANNPVVYNNWRLQEKSFASAINQEQYINLIKAGMGATLKEGEANYRLENDKVNINYVQIPYASIPDSTVVVSDSEIEAYVASHAKEFKVEESRDVQFVYFEEKASQEDEDEVKTTVANFLKFQPTGKNQEVKAFSDITVEEIPEYISANSDISYEDKFLAKEELTSIFKDTLYNLAVGQVYGPYKEGDSYLLTRMVAKDDVGSVKASHILVAYEGATRANPDVKRTKEEAEARANELLAKAKVADADFAELAKVESDGPSKTKGGDLGWFAQGAMVPAFNDYVFGNDKGSIGIVETDFGFHVIKVDDKRGAVKLATISRKIEVSEKTSNTIFRQANNFNVAANDAADFSEAAKANNYDVRRGDKLGAMVNALPGYQNQRSVLQWVYNPDTKVGDVQRISTNKGHVVIQLTGITEKGLMSAKDAASRVRPILVKQKKAKQIMSNNTATTLSELASANSTSPKNAAGLNMKNPVLGAAGREPRVVGSAFALKQGETSGLIEGANGVYMVEITNITKAVDLDSYLTYANTLRGELETKANSAVYQALKKTAEIDDNRKTFY